MNNETDDYRHIRIFVKILDKIYKQIKSLIGRINIRMKGKYSPTLIAVYAGLASAILLTIMLFIPPYLGLSDDGRFSRVMNSAGIYSFDSNGEDSYFNYYIRKYSTITTGVDKSGYFSSLTIFVRVALVINNLFNKNNVFDMRFMALVYAMIFIPALMLLVKHAARQVDNFTEGAIIGIAGVVIFSDVSYITYFSSFYAEALVFVCFLLCIGSALSLEKEGKDDFWLIIYAISGILMITAERQYALSGIFLGILAIAFIFIKKELSWRIGCIVVGFILVSSSFLSYYLIASDFSLSSKFHAMTRGVLLQSSNPEEALEEFGISPNYSVLTDINANYPYPFTKAYNKDLDNGFYNKYNTFDIGYYYIKHPGSMISMLDISVKSVFNTRTDYSGNYEKSVGLKPKAKSLFWSAWSTFKMKSAPKTIGFIFILILAVFIIDITNEGDPDDKRGQIAVETMILIIVIGLSQAITTIVMSGDAEFSSHTFIFSVSIDVLCYFCFSEILHKLNIIQSGGRE